MIQTNKFYCGTYTWHTIVGFARLNANADVVLHEGREEQGLVTVYKLEEKDLVH